MIRRDGQRREKILRVLAGGRRSKISSIANAMGVTAASISPTLSQMKHEELIDREPGRPGNWFAVGLPAPRISRRHPVPSPSRVRYENDVEIEKGVPLPPAIGKTGLAALLRRMEVGDSVVLPYARRGSITTAASHMGMKMTTRRLDADMMRVWRVK